MKTIQIFLFIFLFYFSFCYVICPDEYACPDHFHCCQIEKTSHYSCCYDDYECCNDGYYCCNYGNPLKFLFHKTIKLKSVETIKELTFNDINIIIKNAIEYLNAGDYFDDIEKCGKNITEFVKVVEKFVDDIKNISDYKQIAIVIKNFINDVIPTMKNLFNSCGSASIEIKENIKYLIEVFSNEEYIKKLIENILKNYSIIVDDFVKYREELDNENYENAGKKLGIIIKDIFIL
jgi:hypothetical protein